MTDDFVSPKFRLQRMLNPFRQLLYICRNGRRCRHDDEDEVYPFWRNFNGFGCGLCGCLIPYRQRKK